MELKNSIQRKQQDKSIWIDEKWFGELKTQLEEEDSLVWRNQVLLWELIFAFLENKSLGRRGRNGGWRWVPLPRRTDEPVFGYDLMGFYSDGIKAKWTQSNTDVNWRPTSDADPAQGTAKAATKIHDFYKRKLYTQTFRQTEATLAQCGKYARYYYYSEQIKRIARRPVFEQQQLQFGESTYLCADCGDVGLAGQLGLQPEQMGAGMSGGSDVLSALGGVGSGQQAQQESLGVPGAGMLSGPNSMGVPQNLSPAMAEIPQTNSGAAGPAMGGSPFQGTAGQLNLSPEERALINQQFGHDEAAEWQAGMESPHPPEMEMQEPGEFDHLESIEDLFGPTPGGLCPGCGSPNVSVQESTPFNVQSMIGYETYEIGDIMCESVPAFELKHDITLSPQESPYLIRRRRVRTTILQEAYPFLNITKSTTDDPAMQAEQDLRNSVYGAATGFRHAPDAAQPTAEFIQIWLDPCFYSQSVLKKEMRTLGGMTLPPGTRLLDVFPTGMYMAWIQGVEGVVELRDEHHKDYWVGANYRIRAVSSLGSGLEDMLNLQRQFNLMMSIIYTMLRSSALPATLFEQKFLPSGTSAYLGSLANIPVDTTVLEGRSIRDAVYQLQPQPPSQSHFGMAQQLDILLQKTSRVTDVGLGQAIGLDNSTATGAQLAAANAQSLFGPQLALKAEVDRRGAEIIIWLYRKYTPDEVYVALAGKRGKLDGQWMSAANFTTDLFAEVAFESYLPQTNLERRDRWRNLLMDIGGLPGLKAAMDQMPSLLEQLTELYDVDLGADDYSASAEICWRRIEQMRDAEGQIQLWLQELPPFQYVEDPMSGAMAMVPIDPMQEGAELLMQVLSPPVELEEMGHLQAINWLRSFLTEDQGLEASPLLRAGVKALIAAHIQGLIAEATMMAQIGSVGLMPPIQDQPSGRAGEGAPAKSAKDQKTESGGKDPGSKPSPRPNDAKTRQLVQGGPPM